MFGLYITHPQVSIDPDVPVPQWRLSDFGRNRATEAAARPWVKRLARIVSSAEVKAIETAEILARAAGIGFETVEAMHENDRPATGFLKPDDFEKAADRVLRRSPGELSRLGAGGGRPGPHRRSGCGHP